MKDSRKDASSPMTCERERERERERAASSGLTKYSFGQNVVTEVYFS